MLYVPAPQTVYDDGRPVDRFFVPLAPQPMPEPAVEERLTKELRFDPDAWIVETEDRAGRHFLELAKSLSHRAAQDPSRRRLGSLVRAVRTAGLEPGCTLGRDWLDAPRGALALTVMQRRLILGARDGERRAAPGGQHHQRGAVAEAIVEPRQPVDRIAPSCRSPA